MLIVFVHKIITLVNRGAQNSYIKKWGTLSSIISYSTEIFKCLYSEFSFPLNDILLEGTDKKVSKEYINKNQKNFYCL
ncbi:hypothetical protein HMPREF3239_06585 [Staphylococcus sp. HMSC34C02]|nr:hypothetical protein HMPREF3239_06585 [Staphylococcus sp. HMSC34C02]